MTEERLPLAELLAKAGDGDFLRSVIGERSVILVRLMRWPWTTLTLRHARSAST